MDNHKLLKKLRGAYQVCSGCGLRHGEIKGVVSTCWNGVCDVCGAEGSVTEARDYGYLQLGIEYLKKEIDDEAEEKREETKPQKYRSRLSCIYVENTESLCADGLTEVFLNDEGAGGYISLKQDGQEITLDPEEIDLVYEACKKLLNQ